MVIYTELVEVAPQVLKAALQKLAVVEQQV
jgi:hypothetical protein